MELIEVEYDELPKVTNIEEAIAPGAIQVHEGGVARAELRGSVYGAPERFSGTNVCYYLNSAVATLQRALPKRIMFPKISFVFKRFNTIPQKPTITSSITTARS